jgi:hypothetical protein
VNRRIVFAALALAALGALTAALLLRSPAPGPHGPAADRARAACASADRFIALVDRNASIADAKTELARATRDATRATTLDPMWAPLQSGLETFTVALDNDDAGSANMAVRVVRGRCAIFRSGS